MGQTIHLPLVSASPPGPGPLAVRSCAAAGRPGKSAYELAVEQGFSGTEEEWLASLVGPQGAAGADGKSAYQVAVDGGFTGDEQAWLASLTGPAGADGADGAAGADGEDGADGVSPVVTLERVKEGVQITIADAVGTQQQTVYDGATGAAGAAGAAGPAGPGVPSGGTAGQLLKKDSATDYDTSWVDPPDFVLTLSENSGAYSVDKTYAQALAAHSAGKRVLLNTGVGVIPMIRASDEFYCWLASQDGYAVTRIELSSLDTVSVDQKLMEPGTTVAAVSGTAPTISAQNRVEYECGTLTSLTVSSVPTNGSCLIVFTSGSTAATTSFPASVAGLESFAAKANTRYEISVRKGYAVIGEWTVSAS